MDHQAAGGVPSQVSRRLIVKQAINQTSHRLSPRLFRDRITRRAKAMVHEDSLVMAGAITRAAHRLARAEDEGKQDPETEPVKAVSAPGRPR